MCRGNREGRSSSRATCRTRDVRSEEEPFDALRLLRILLRQTQPTRDGLSEGNPKPMKRGQTETGLTILDSRNRCVAKFRA